MEEWFRVLLRKRDDYEKMNMSNISESTRNGLNILDACLQVISALYSELLGHVAKLAIS